MQLLDGFRLVQQLLADGQPFDLPPKPIEAGLGLFQNRLRRRQLAQSLPTTGGKIIRQQYDIAERCPFLYPLTAAGELRQQALNTP